MQRPAFVASARFGKPVRNAGRAVIFFCGEGRTIRNPAALARSAVKARDVRLRNLRRKHLFMRGKRGARYAVFHPKYCAAANKIKFRFAGREYLPGTICSQLLHRKHKQIVTGAGGAKPERLAASSVTRHKVTPSEPLLNSTLEASSARTIPTPGQSRARGAPAPCWPASSRSLTC